MPWLAEPVGLHPGCPPPLVVITINEERELPAAFLRRCMVLRLQLPTDPAERTDCLVRRGGEHFGADCTTGGRGFSRWPVRVARTGIGRRPRPVNGHEGLSVTQEHASSLWDRAAAATRYRGANSDARFSARSHAEWGY